MCSENTWAESAVHDNKSVHVCCALLSCQVLLSSYAVSRPDKRRVIHDRESCRPMSSTSLVSRSTVSQHACPCSCLVSVTCSLSLSLGYRAVQVPRVVLSKNLALKLCPRDFCSQSHCAAPRRGLVPLVSDTARSAGGGFCPVHLKPSRPLVMRVIESGSPRQAPPRRAWVLCLASK